MSNEIQELKDEIESRIEELDEGYSNGDLDFEYGEHLEIVKDVWQNLSYVVTNLDEPDFEHIDGDLVKDSLLKLDIAISFLEQIRDNEQSEFEQEMVELSKDYIRKAGLTSVKSPTVLTESDFEEYDARLVTTYNIKTSENSDYDFKVNRNLPFVEIPKSWEDNPELWPIITHEIAHTVSSDVGRKIEDRAGFSYAEEYLADMVAFHVLDKLYYNAIISICQDLDEYSRDKEHPSWHERVYALIDQADLAELDHEEYFGQDLNQQWKSITGRQPSISDQEPYSKAKNKFGGNSQIDPDAMTTLRDSIEDGSTTWNSKLGELYEEIFE
ncbi:MAG: hypothetical protein ABEJ83_00875 [Candidatus Nanohaloarchaea archaeon]